MTNTKINSHFGSDFEDFLAEEGILEHCTAIATKRVLIWQLSEQAKFQHQSAGRSGTDCTAVVHDQHTLKSVDD